LDLNRGRVLTIDVHSRADDPLIRFEYEILLLLEGRLGGYMHHDGPLGVREADRNEVLLIIRPKFNGTHIYLQLLGHLGFALVRAHRRGSDVFFELEGALYEVHISLGTGEKETLEILALEAFDSLRLQLHHGRVEARLKVDLVTADLNGRCIPQIPFIRFKLGYTSGQVEGIRTLFFDHFRLPLVLLSQLFNKSSEFEVVVINSLVLLT